MKSYIYTIQNKLNNKIYVGKSNDTKIRWAHHIKVSRGGKSKYPKDFFAIHGALAKYGIDNFNFQIIEEFDDEQECLDAEGFWIEYLKTTDRSIGYNLSLGGDGPSPTAETKLKMSKAQQGAKHSQATLNEAQVIEILHKYTNEDCTQNQLAIEYGVSRTTINDIMKKRTWTHITKNYQHIKKAYKHPGEQSGSSKLTENNVIEVIKLYNSGQHTYKEIATMFNVNEATVGAIIRGTNWKHIKRD